MTQIDSFAVVDFETTGFSPRHHHRIIEIGIVRTDSSGRMTEEYETLINPNRDVGPTHIHGICPSDLKEAPRFEDVAGDVLSLLAGSVFVAHNARFDLSFLGAETERLGVRLPAVPYVCTMEAAFDLDPDVPCRQLGAVCEHMGIPLGAEHCALSDARASAQLLAQLLVHKSRRAGTPAFRLHGDLLPASAWPSLPRNGRRFARRIIGDPVAPADPFLASLVKRLPSYKDATAETNAYLLCLDQALADRLLSDQERQELSDIATNSGLLREQVQEVHRRYLADLVRIALDDGVITSTERTDLELVARLMALGDGAVSVELKTQGYQTPEMRSAAKASSAVSDDLRGKKVCFTGTFVCTFSDEQGGRDVAERMAHERGMIVKPHVVKSLALVVAADTESMSIKAKKAREYGIRIISEREYWSMMGLDPL